MKKRLLSAVRTPFCQIPSNVVQKCRNLQQFRSVKIGISRFFTENVAQNGRKSPIFGQKNAPFCCKNANLPNRTRFTRLPPPPPPPCALGPLPPTSLGRPLPEPCEKSQGGLGEEGRRGRGGKGFGLREGSSDYNGGWGGALQTPVGARPTSGGSQYFRRNPACLNRLQNISRNYLGRTPPPLERIVPANPLQRVVRQGRGTRTAPLASWSPGCFSRPLTVEFGNDCVLGFIICEIFTVITLLTRPQLGPFFALKFVCSRVLGRDFFNRFQSP